MSEVEKTRYSDEELAEFKAIILDKLEKAKADYELLRSSITHTMSNDTEDTSPTFKVLEEGAATLSKRSRAGSPSDSSNSYSISKRLSCVSRTRPTEYAAKRAN